MNKTTLVLLSICFLSATLLVVVLFAMSDKIVHEPNNFLRSYPSHFVTKEKEIDIRYNSYYIAGLTNSNIFLGNVVNPFELLIVNMNLTDTARVQLRINNMENLKLTKLLRTKVDSPFFYLTDGLMPGLFRGRLGNWTADRFMYDSVYFTQATPIAGSSFAIRSKSSKTLENVLGKVTNKKPHVIFEPNLLQKQIDGIFCTDGLLHYSHDLNRLIYLYYYRNEYIVYDTNLNIDYRGHTIDTFRIAQIKVDTINSENSTVLSASKLVNDESCVSGSYLFIKSPLIAKNDVKTNFPHFTIIDVYDLRENKYKLSFQVQNHYGSNGARKIYKFSVLKNKKLVAIHDHYLVVYSLLSEYLDQDLIE